MHNTLKCTLIALLIALMPVSALAYKIPLFLPYPKLDSGRWYTANGWKNSDIQACEWRKEAISAEDNALKITLSDKGAKVSDYSCGEIQTRKTHRYGLYIVRMKAAKGDGLNSSFFTYIGPVHKQPHEEIDFEFLGKDTTGVQLNYYINGKPQGETWIPLGFDASEAYHNYSFMWEPDKITWYVDDKKVHQTKPGAKIPSVPMKMYLTLWSGSSLVNDWLGPFKYEEDAAAYFSDVSFTPMPEDLR